ncbi:MAG: hypothetical protein AAB110_02575 [Candidatus Desantisbacteria bacterium]
MAKEINRDDMRELLGVIKDILGPDVETQQQDSEWKKEMENPQVDADTAVDEMSNGRKYTNHTGSSSYYQKIEPETTSSKSFWTDMVNFLWIVVIVGAIGYGCWWLFSSGTVSKAMNAVKQQGTKAVKTTTGWAQK